MRTAVYQIFRVKGTTSILEHVAYVRVVEDAPNDPDTILEAHRQFGIRVGEELLFVRIGEAA